MSWDREDANFVRFDKYFASKMSALLALDNPRIPKALLELIRPKEFSIGLKVSHNWGDIVPYPVSTIFKVYGFLRTHHVLTY